MNVGVIIVFDECLIKFVELVYLGCIVFIIVEIVDIVGFVKGVSKGEGLGNKFLVNICEIDVILYVFCCFDDENVIYVDGSVDLVCDKEIIDIEF